MKFIIISALVIAILLGGTLVYADAATAPTQDPTSEQYYTAKVGISPTNPFYVFQRAGEGIDCLFKFNSQDKVLCNMKYADRRLGEAITLQNSGNLGAAEASYDEYSATVDSSFTQVPVQPSPIKSIIKRALISHASIFDKKGQNLPNSHLKTILAQKKQNILDKLNGPVLANVDSGGVV